MKIDPTQIHLIKAKKPIHRDPIRFPKIIGTIEDNMKKSYQLQCNKMLVDLTKKMVELKK